MKAWMIALALGMAAPAAAASPPTPLFAADEPLRITIRAPIGSLVSDRTNNVRAGTLTVAGASGALPIALSARGITRRRDDICPFPPLRVEFTQPPPAGSVFQQQRRLKLVTHCRPSESFQQKVLLEYAAYRLYNVLTPMSFRARLATIDYVDDGGRPTVSRVGFFIEDIDDVARRNTMVKVNTPDRIPATQVDPAAAGRFAVFEYLIGNLDWSMRAGPPGEGCCHNARLIGASQSAAALTPVPYDFDYSGLVDAPYAAPPPNVRVRSVRERSYRGYCMHNAHANAAAAQITARRAELLAALGTIPGLEERTRARAASYLEGFFADAASGKMLKACLS